MSHRYKVRTFSSGEGDGATAEGTIVHAIDRSFSVVARNAEEVEKTIRQDISRNKLPKGRVYQICPQFGNPESIRAFAVCLQGVAQRVFLDPAQGIYSEFRSIRYEDLRKTPRPGEANPPEVNDQEPILQEAS